MFYVILVTTGRGLMLHSRRRGEEDELKPSVKNTDYDSVGCVKSAARTPQSAVLSPQSVVQVLY